MISSNEFFSTKEYAFLKDVPYLNDNIFYLTLGGSRAYGTNLPESDYDLRGGYIEKPGAMFALEPQKDMYPNGISPRLMQYVADYKVNLVSPTLMSDDELDIFKSDLKEVLKFIKHSNDKESLKKLLDDDPGYQDINRLAAQTISICSNVKFNIPVGKEGINVCKAIEDMKMDARNEGRNEGLIEGRNEGRNEGLNEGILMAVSMLKNLKLTKDAAVRQIEESYSLPYDEAVALVNSRW